MNWKMPLTKGAFVGLIMYSLRKLRGARVKAIALQGKLHSLKEQNFALRYEEAKRSGAFDRWEGEA